MLSRLNTQIIYSNSLRELGKALLEQLFAHSDPFAKRWVIVPTEAMKIWVQRFLAQEAGVALGIRFFFLEELVRGLPSELELTLRLECLLPDCEELKVYFEGKPTRIHPLAATLASHFRDYGVYGGAMLKTWEGWQVDLWKRCCQSPSIEVEGARLHLFAFHQIPLLYQKALQRLGSLFYVLSPCAMYWEDARSQGEIRAIERHFRLKGAREEQLVALDLFLREIHPLIANWGKVGRRLMSQLEQGDPRTLELYKEPLQDSQLHSLQRDILLLERSRARPDGSIEIHGAPNRWREVEALHQRLLCLIDQGQWNPSEVLVMAPNIEEYFPFLQAVFEREGKMKLQVRHLQRLSKNEWLIGLLNFLSGGWEASRMCALFEQLHVLNQEELARFKEWIEEAGIRRGVLDWSEGLDRLSLTYATEDRWDLEDGALLERICGWIDRLSSRLPLLSSTLTLGEWTVELDRFAFELLGVQQGDLPPIEALRALIPSLPTERFPFTSIASLIEKQTTQRSETYQRHELDAVICGSIFAMRGIPAKVICLLGMQEGAYPRLTTTHPFDLLASSRQGDYRPSSADLDRYLFLEALLSAEHSFLIFYSTMHGEEGKPLAPSPLVEELRQEVGVEIEQHPCLPFRFDQFPNKNSSSIDFARAQAFYGSPKPIPLLEMKKSENCFELRDLLLSARDPMQLHLRRGLGVEIKEEKPLKDSESFAFSPLQMHRLAIAALEKPLEEVLEREKFKMPSGPLGQVALTHLQTRVEEMQKRLKGYGVAGEPLTLLRFERGCLKPVRLGDEVLMPPLTLKLGERHVEIVGEIPFVTSKGLLANGKKDLGSIARQWPLFLTYCAANISPPQLFLMQEERVIISDPPLAREALARYLSYHIQCLEEPAPLASEWIDSVFSGDASKLQKVMERDRFLSPYLRWWIERHPLSSAEVIKRWAGPLEGAFGLLLEQLGRGKWS